MLPSVAVALRCAGVLAAVRRLFTQLGTGHRRTDWPRAGLVGEPREKSSLINDLYAKRRAYKSQPDPPRLTGGADVDDIKNRAAVLDLYARLGFASLFGGLVKQMELNQIFLWIALGFSFVGLLAHEFAGAPRVIPPLAQSGMPDTVKSLHGFSWHVGSIAVIAMIAMFGCAATLENQMPMAVIASAMSLGFTLLALGMGMSGHRGLWKTPAPYLWALVAIMGFGGVLTSGELV